MTFSRQKLNFIPLWEWTWSHCVLCVRQGWKARSVFDSQENTYTSQNANVYEERDNRKSLSFSNWDKAKLNLISSLRIWQVCMSVNMSWYQICCFIDQKWSFNLLSEENLFIFLLIELSEQKKLQQIRHPLIHACKPVACTSYQRLPNVEALYPQQAARPTHILLWSLDCR